MLKRFFFKILLRYGSDEMRVKIYRRLGVNIGKYCSIYPKVSFGSEPYLITVGNNVRISNGVMFVTHDGGIWVLRNLDEFGLRNADIFGMIKIGNNVHIGINCIIMPGVTIGDNCIIGCGAIVTKDIPDNSVAAGIPAKIIKNIDEYYEKNRDKCDLTKDMNAEAKRQYLSSKYHL